MAISLPARVNHAGVLMVLVTGGRHFDDEPDLLLHSTLAFIEQLCFEAGLQMAVVQGGATGADAAARNWAMENHVMIYNEPARWNKYGRNAGPIRNQLMIDKHKPDICIAAPGGDGTTDMVGRCHVAHIPTYNLNGDSHGGT